MLGKQMIHAPYQRLHYAFHLHAEQDGVQLVYRQVGFYRQGIDMQVTPGLQQLRHLLLLWREVNKQVTLYG